jgi:hypothetical protein
VALDPRYSELLDLDAGLETTPNHYQLLGVGRGAEQPAIKRAFRQRMSKLQQIKSSKHKGFIEMLKEELREANRTLSNASRCRAYDAEVVSGQLEVCRRKVREMLSLLGGRVAAEGYSRLVDMGLRGTVLDRADVEQVIAEAAKELGASVMPPSSTEPRPAGSDSAPGTLGSGPSGGVPAPGSHGLGGVEGGQLDSGPMRLPQAGGSGVQRRRPIRAETAASARRPLNPVRPRPAPPVAPSTSGRLRRPELGEGAPAKVTRRGFYESGGGLAISSSEAGRGVGSEERATTAPGGMGLAHGGGSEASRDAARQLLDGFNRGVKSLRFGFKAHEQLQRYFPPWSGSDQRVYQLSGISFEKLFEIELKMYRDAEKRFTSLQGQLAGGGLGRSLPVDLSSRVSSSLAKVREFLGAGRRLKFELMGGVPKARELEIWADFLGQERPIPLTRRLTFDE